MRALDPLLQGRPRGTPPASVDAEVRLFLLSLALGCATSQQAPPAAAPAGAVSPVNDAALADAITRGQIPDLTRAMNDHYVDALRLEMAIIGGDLEGAQRQGGVLSQMTLPPELMVVPAAQVHLDAVRAAGQRAATAVDLASSAAALGDLAHACGQCHTATGGGPRDVVPPPDLSEGMMSLHLHGAYWMGFGLFAPNDAAWQSGIDAFTLSKTASSTNPLQASPERLRELTGAARAASPETRPGLWAQLLVTCSECHGPLRPPDAH